MIYKFRAETTADVINGLNGIDFVLLEIIEPIESLPDCEVTIKSDWSLEELQQHILSVDDCHVMAETIQPIEKYNGERNYDLELIPESIKRAIDHCVEVGKIKGDLSKNGNPSLPLEACSINQMAGLEEYQFRVYSVEGLPNTTFAPTRLTIVKFQAFKGGRYYPVFIEYTFKDNSDFINSILDKIYTHDELFKLLTSK